MWGQTSITFDAQDEYYYRILQISGIADDPSSFNLRPIDPSASIKTAHPWQDIVFTNEKKEAVQNRVDFFEPMLFQSYNTNVPRGTNDGAIWQGRGYNLSFTVGAEASIGPLNVRFRPLLGMAQNRSFDLGPYKLQEIEGGIYEGSSLSKYAYRDFRGSIDYVQRYGSETYSWFDLGDTSIELKYSGFRLAFSNRQIWTGPAINTSLHYGYSAPGFRHLYLGTYKPWQTIIGGLEFAYIFGKTKESDYYTINQVVDSQSVNSLVFIYKPWFTDRFSMGIVRTFFHEYPNSFSEYKSQAKKLLQSGLKNALATEENPTGTSPDNQMASIFFRYIIPESGFEVYTEFGRNDHNANWRDFRAHPDHHRAYTIGLIKSFQLAERRLLAVNLEINQLEANRISLTRGSQHLGGWFTHTNQILGFTNKGQIMGTGYGPGVNLQMLRGDLFDESGSYSLKIARIVYHNSRVDQYFRFIEDANSEPVEPWQVRNVEYMIGIGKTFFLPQGIELTGSIEQSVILNHHNLKQNDLMNTRFELIVRKRIEGWLR